MNEKYTVIIDAAHGGKDLGKCANNFHEKDYCLYLSKYLMLALNQADLTVKLSREEDYDLDPSSRIDKIKNLITNSNKTIIISLHSHFDDKNTAIIYSKDDNTNLASIIYKNMKENNLKATKPTVKILPADWNKDYHYIMREINQIPTIILSCFYNTTNPSENCNKIISVIAKSILKFIESTDMRYSYTVKKGDSLYSIAKNNNTTVENIKNLNNLSSNLLSLGQILEIPDNDDTDTLEYFTYTVKSGDNLYAIARKYNTTAEQIKNLNNLASNLLSIGQILKIPLKIPSDETITIPTYENYVVKKGDSLYSIAKKFNTNVNDIMKDNSLTSTNLTIGQVLKIKTSSSDFIPTDECIGDPSLYEEVEETEIYIVEKGDSLYSIARKFNTTVDNIIKANNLTSTSLSIGQSLEIPKSSTETTTTINYTVKKGDSLYSISKLYNTTPENIKNLNNLKSNNLAIGQILKIERKNN